MAELSPIQKQQRIKRRLLETKINILFRDEIPDIESYSQGQASTYVNSSVTTEEVRRLRELARYTVGSAQSAQDAMSDFTSATEYDEFKCIVLDNMIFSAEFKVSQFKHTFTQAMHTATIRELLKILNSKLTEHEELIRAMTTAIHDQLTKKP